VFALITGNQKFLLIRESFLTLAYGLICLGSLLLPRPIMFYFGRHFATGNDPIRIASYNALWRYPGFRSLNRLVTIVWGIGMLGDFVIRLALIYALSVAQVLVIAPIVTYVIIIGLIIWTMAISLKAARRGEAIRQQRLAIAQDAGGRQDGQ
jgi:hypothetical protein